MANMNERPDGQRQDGQRHDQQRHDQQRHDQQRQVSGRQDQRAVNKAQPTGQGDPRNRQEKRQ